MVVPTEGYEDASLECGNDNASGGYCNVRPPPPPTPPPRTNRTRRVLHSVLIGHAASFTPY